jgi:hypothetical protein
MDQLLYWFVRCWIVLAIGINLIAIVGFLISSESLWSAWERIAETYSPFNVWNLAAEFLLLSPAILAQLWLDRRTRRSG